MLKKFFEKFIFVWMLIAAIILAVVADHFIPRPVYGDAGIPKYQKTYPHGHKNINDGGVLNMVSSQLSSLTTTTVSSVSLGTVTANDVFIACGQMQITFSTAPTTYFGALTKYTGTATVTTIAGLNGTPYAIYFQTPTSNMAGSTCTLFKVTIGGTLSMQNLVTIAGGTGVTYLNTLNIAFFLKQ